MLCFAFFSKFSLYQNQRSFPLFLQNGWTHRAQNFFTSTLTKLGCVFFFYKMFSLKNLAAFRKTGTIEKNRFSATSSVFCLDDSTYPLTIFYWGERDQKFFFLDDSTYPLTIFYWGANDWTLFCLDDSTYPLTLFD